MTMRFAILSGSGSLPRLLQRALDGVVAVAFDGVDHDLDPPVAVHRFEQLGVLFTALHDAGVTHVVMAGAMQRPVFDQTKLDPFTKVILPDLGAAMAQGDDVVLRFLIDLIQSQGFIVIGAHEVLRDLTIDDGALVGEFDPSLTDTLVRADHVLKNLGPCDVGQAVVAEAGQIIGIETLQGTEFLLNSVSQTPDHLRRPPCGILVKRPKAHQDLRVDMPAIGPETIDQVYKAGLNGIVISPNAVMIIDRDAVIERARKYGIFIVAKGATC